MPKRVPSDQKKAVISVSLSRYIIDLIEQEAEEDGLTISATIEISLKEYLKAKGYPIGELYKSLDETADRAKVVFLQEMAIGAGVLVACQAAGVSTATVYRWLKQDSTFAQEYRLIQGKHRPLGTSSRNPGRQLDEYVKARKEAQSSGRVRGRRVAQEVTPEYLESLMNGAETGEEL